ncbi:GNAT family N-acetyltransferase [Cohnella hashimotonis]|uniref:GNAT family N-acetyltransferase n=1 Tax=Cohnella hashimotonis TaxID=2826895 RepID=A0ABT6TT56_9BACL|nr:GNAT family N-acetyltransferase [Cohnella hashimotonis]MDI4649904.1 GNAT family N-acetyltransferase [Cohnella hashimotonis]
MATVDDESIHYRIIANVSELHACVKLQKQVWGPDTITSMQQMRAAILHGGSVIGAFCGEALVGFCYSFIGYDGREPYVGSHMMAIQPEYRDRGIGMRLKLEQRLWAMEAGYGKIVWTFDPFESRNGYLNIVKLGGTVSAYIPEFYGTDDAGFPTDRFVVTWDLSSERVFRAIGGQQERGDETSGYPRLLTVEGAGGQLSDVGVVQAARRDLIGTTSRVRLPIPRFASKLRQARPDIYQIWQRGVRDLAMAAFAHGYQIVSCHPSEPETLDYILEMKR